MGQGQPKMFQKILSQKQVEWNCFIYWKICGTGDRYVNRNLGNTKDVVSFLIYGGNLNVKKLFGSEKSLGDT